MLPKAIHELGVSDMLYRNDFLTFYYMLINL